MITSARCLETCKLLGWSRDRLAPRCGLSAVMLRRFEGGSHRLTFNQLGDLKQVLEAAGIELTNGGEPGVKLRKQA